MCFRLVKAACPRPTNNHHHHHHASFPLPTPASSASSPNSRPTNLRPTRCSSTPSAYAATTTILTALTITASTAATPAPCVPRFPGSRPRLRECCRSGRMRRRRSASGWRWGMSTLTSSLRWRNRQEYYKDSMMPMTLRMVAENVYGSGYGMGQRPMPEGYRYQC